MCITLPDQTLFFPYPILRLIPLKWMLQEYHASHKCRTFILPFVHPLQIAQFSSWPYWIHSKPQLYYLCEWFPSSNCKWSRMCNLFHSQAITDLILVVTASAVLSNAISKAETRDRILWFNPNSLSPECPPCHPVAKFTESEDLKIQSKNVISLPEARSSHLNMDYQKYPPPSLSKVATEFYSFFHQYF